MTVQLAFNLDAAQAAENGACNAPVPSHAGTSQNGSTRAETRSCAVCAGPLDPGKKATARYCSRRCKDRADEARAAERDHANGACHEPRRCECDRPLLILDDDLAETRCLHCGRPR